MSPLLHRCSDTVAGLYGLTVDPNFGDKCDSTRRRRRLQSSGGSSEVKAGEDGTAFVDACLHRVWCLVAAKAEDTIEAVRAP